MAGKKRRRMICLLAALGLAVMMAFCIGGMGRYVCNALVALIAAMLINYVAVMLSSQTRRTSDSELLEHTMSYYEINDPDAKYVSSAETYRTNWFVEIMKGLAVNPFERWK